MDRRGGLFPHRPDGRRRSPNGDISEDPLFVSSTDPHLSALSPCIDKGSIPDLPPDVADLDSDGDIYEDIPFDVDGNPRVQGDGVDMGAYESP